MFGVFTAGAEMEAGVRLVAKTDQYRQGLRAAGQSTSKFARDVKASAFGAESALGRMSTKARSSLAGLDFRKIRRGLAVAGAAVAAFAAVTIGTFASFDAAMTKSLAIMGNVSAEMRGEMSTAARLVATTTSFSANEAADSYFFLASAGLDAAAAVKAMPQVAAFAQAGMFDLANATDLLTDAQSALGLTSKNTQANLIGMTRVSDVLVKANTLANASVEQFSKSLTNKAGAALRALGKDVEEGVAVLAAFADQGLKGEAAGEALNIVLRDLQKAALENEGAFRRARVAVFDEAGEMRNLADVVGDLEEHLGGMSDAQRKTALSTLGFQERSVSQLITLLGTSAAIREYEGELRTAAGTTQEVADNQLNTMSEQLGLLRDKFKELGIAIGEDASDTIMNEAIPALDQLADVLGNILQTGEGESAFGTMLGWVAGWGRDLAIAGLAFAADPVAA